MTEKREHWEAVYEKKAADEVSWYQPHLERSLELIRATRAPKTARIIDVGAGASTLAEDLLREGFGDITVVDVAESALAVAKARMGADASRIDWRVGDILSVELPGAYDIWHDRAVFHFLTDPEHRRRYLERVCESLKTGGHVILATFGPEGPDKCSGLPVVRYAPDELKKAFGDNFELVESLEEHHETPQGRAQAFVYCLCTKQRPC